MDRGLRAQLSPNEETALRKIAAGSDVGRIQLAYLEQLAALQLIEARDGKWQLTEFGEARTAVRAATPVAEVIGRRPQPGRSL